MEISFSRFQSKICPHCNATFEAEIWLIVDTIARPDLLEQIYSGTLHNLICANCNQFVAQVDAPLLLYRTSETPLLLFSQAQQSMDQEDLEDVRDLVNILRRNSGDDWQEAWLEQGLTGISRPYLVTFLKNHLKPVKPAKSDALSDVPAEFQDDLQRVTETQQYYELTGNQSALESTIIALEGILNHPAFLTTSKQFQTIVLNDTGASFMKCYWATGNRNDLDKSISLLKEAIERTPIDSPDLPIRLSNLGNALREHYRSTGILEDLEQAIEAHQHALQGMPTNSAYLPAILNNLGSALREHYESTGILEDLEQAIEVHQRALQYISVDQSGLFDQPGLLSRFNNLGLAMRARYERTGQLEDLEQAIEAFQKAVQHSPTGSPDRPAFLTNLGLGLRARYGPKMQLEDLEQAIEAFQEAVQLTPTMAPTLPSRLTNLGGGLCDHYEHSLAPEDLEQAIQVFQTAIQHTPINSPELPGILSNFGGALQHRYILQGKLEDLDQAILVLQEAIQCAVGDTPILPSTLHNLATCLNARYEWSGQQEDLQKGIALAEEACQQGIRFAPEIALISAVNWGERATNRRHWTEAARAYTYGVQAAEQLYRSQLLRTNQEVWLSKMRDLYTRAAYILALIGQLPEATVTLEKGRAKGLNEALARDRADLERVRQEDQKVYKRYQQATNRLRQLERATREGHLADVDHSIALAIASPFEQVHQTRKEVEQAIANIRQIPGYEEFLVEPTYSDVIQAAQPGIPLVYIVTTPLGSLALLIHSASNVPEIIWLNSFTEANLHSLLIKVDDEAVVRGYLLSQLINPQWMKQTLNELLPELARELVGPIATRLHILEARGVVLIPAGLLGLLPLHATCYQFNGQQLCLLDEFDVAYIPSARVLSATRHEWLVRQSLPVSPRLVGVGNPLPDLELGTWAQSELRRITPILKQAVNAHKLRLQSQNTVLLSEKYTQIQALISLLEMVLQSLQTLCLEPQERLLHAGRDLQRVAVLLASLPGLPNDIITTIVQLADRIPPSLTYAHAELESIQTLLPKDAVIGFYEHQATHDVLWNTLPEATIAHFACHGQFDPETPLDSALLLACETRLTLRNLLNADPEHLACLRLAFLSACQTAITDFQRIPDEVMGLLAGFLQAGVPSVVATLWSIDDVSTVLLTTRFYELYLHGNELMRLSPLQPTRALRLSQNWLRGLTYNNLLAYLIDMREAQRLSPRLLVELFPLVRRMVSKGQGDKCPYADPYHWAAFVYHGAL